MHEPTWSELVPLPEGRAVERFFDARNDRFLRPALFVAELGAAIAATVFATRREWGTAALWAALVVGIAAVFVLRRLGIFDRRPRAYLLGFMAALAVAVALGIGEPVAAYVLAGFLLPAMLGLLRLRPGETLGLAALDLGAAAWAIGRFEPGTSGSPLALGLLALAATGGAAWASLRFTRRLRRHFLGEWRHHAALAREHSRMRTELDDARAVQLSMLPRTAPELPWVELASTTMPATEVGGDYFGYFPLDGGRRLAIAIADVAGHGMASGLVLSGLRSGLHLLREEMARPVEVLGRLDRMLRETSPGRMFVTLQIALLDAERGELVVANAGHPPLLMLPAGGRPATVGAPGPPLGTRLEPAYAEARHPLGPGDTLVLYTDGVPEVRNRGGDGMGDERLLAEAARGARTAGTAREVRDGLIGAVARFKGDVEPADDLTLVVARIVAAAGGGRPA